LDVKIPEFLKAYSRSTCSLQVPTTLDKSAFSRARQKLSWKAFESIFHSARDLAFNSMGNPRHFLWKEKSVYAMDSSKFTLPASSELRKEFDPNSGQRTKGKGHYPQAMVMTITDVLRQIPIARKLAPCDSSERHVVMDMIQMVPEGGIILADRGFPSHEMIDYLSNNYQGYFVIRCPAKSSFKEFGQMKGYDAKLTIAGASLRAIRVKSPDGTESILLTNLLDKMKYSSAGVRDLYFKRWQIEVYFRDEKCSMDLEHFHSKSSNGIRQELFASMIMATLARILMHLRTDNIERPPQFKHAVSILAKEVFLLVAERASAGLRLFRELVDEIGRVVYYRPKQKRPTYPRISKTAQNRWRQAKVGVVRVA
jgi:Transposase DDE domain